MAPVRKASHHGRNIIGYFPSLKLGRMVNFESLIERDLIYLLDYEHNVEQFSEQPLTLEYLHDGKRRKYTPDFHAVLSRQNFLVEVKPQQMVDDPDNQIRFEAARRWCHARGWRFSLVTDERLAGTWRLPNVKLLTRFARYAIGPQVKGRIFACLSAAPGPLRVSDVMQWVSPDAPQSALIPMLHMAYHHEVYIPLDDAPITVGSLIALSSIPPAPGLLLP